MSAIRGVLHALRGGVLELWGLFVEDASFTIGIVVCIIVAISVLPRLPIPPLWRGATLFAILALVLVENVLRAARKRAPL